MIAHQEVFVFCAEPGDKTGMGTHARIGAVELLGAFGDDEFIANAARTSFNKESTDTERNRKLIHYLYRNKHTSPLEMGNITFRITAPIFVARQWVRHRTAKMNEVSRRYVDSEPHFYIPDSYRARPEKSVKQGSDPYAAVSKSDVLRADVIELYDEALRIYDKMIEEGVAPELARMHLPLSTYTTWVWQMDLHNLFHFLKLREDSHAQAEIREFAHTIHDMINAHLPQFSAAMEVFEDMQGLEEAVRTAANVYKDDLSELEMAILDIAKDKELENAE